MTSVGDMKNNLRILQAEAKQMKYTGEFDLEGLIKGNPQSLLPLYNHLFTNFNPEFTEEVMNLLGDGLSMKADVRFMESAYKIFRDMFHYKPPMTKEQFFTLNNFAERKVIMCYEVMRLVKEHCRFLGPRYPTNPHIKVESVVDTGRHSKRGSECELVTSEPTADAAVKSRKSASSLRGLPEKDGYHINKGYLRPAVSASAEDGRKSGRTSREDGTLSREGRVPREAAVVDHPVKKAAAEVLPKEGKVSKDASLAEHNVKKAPAEVVPKEGRGTREAANHHTIPKKAAAEIVVMPSVGQHTETAHMRMSDMLGKTQDHGNEWDPSEAVECILAKVRDLPTQLTSFMKAVEGRLQKIEERLDVVENTGNRVNHTEGSNPSAHLKQDLATVQSRLLLLENRVTLCENKIPTVPVEHSKFADDKKTELATANPFVSLERGEIGVE